MLNTKKSLLHQSHYGAQITQIRQMITDFISG